MAFGKDADNFYLMYITSDATTLSTSGQGERIVIAKAGADSNTADIWFIGRSFQKTPDSATGTIKAVASRVIANKSTGSFTFSLVNEPSGNSICSIFTRSNGTKTYVEARTAVPGSTNACTDVTGMVPGTAACYDATTMATTTDCSAVSTVPTDFGAESTFIDTDLSGLAADSESITKLDFAALGVGEFVKQ